MSFVQRLINVQFNAAQSPSSTVNKFAESGTGQLTLSGLRIHCELTQAANPTFAHASLQIYGMTLSQMNQLGTFGMLHTFMANNTIIIQAGDAQSGMYQVFNGQVQQAWANFQGAPNVPFHVEAQALGVQQVALVNPASYQGKVPVTTIMQSLASQMGLGFQNNGVQAQLNNPYFPGSAVSQCNQCAAAGAFNWNVDLSNNTLNIWPRGGSTNANAIIVGPPPIGSMIGYPTFTAAKMFVRNIFDARFKNGQKVTVQGSSIPVANGSWTIFGIKNTLEALMPHGAWESELELSKISLGSSGQQSTLTAQ